MAPENDAFVRVELISLFSLYAFIADQACDSPGVIPTNAILDFFANKGPGKLKGA